MKAACTNTKKNRMGFSEEPHLTTVGWENFVGHASLPKLNVYRILFFVM